MSDQPADMKIKTINIDDLKNDPENARKHSEKQLQAIEKSLKEFGQRRPLIVLPDNTVIAGNGTLQAARRLGWKAMSVTVFPHKERAKIRAFALADNRTSDLAEWDDDILLTTLAEVQGADLLDATGFTQFDLDDLRVPDVERDDDGKPSGIIMTPNLQDYVSRYAEATVRLLMCEYDNDEYVWVIDQFNKVREANELESNAEAIVFLLRRYADEAS